MDPLVSDLFKSLIGLGPGGVVAAYSFYLWRDERTERRAVQEKYTEMLQQNITSRVEMASALERLADKIGAK